MIRDWPVLREWQRAVAAQLRADQQHAAALSRQLAAQSQAWGKSAIRVMAVVYVRQSSRQQVLEHREPPKPFRAARSEYGAEHSLD
jgi:hypothetical protein